MRIDNSCSKALPITDRKKSKVYGPPYVRNEQLEEDFIEEVRSESFSVRVLHRYLCIHKINPNIHSKKKYQQNQNKPLHYAAKHGSTRLIRMLLRAGADPNTTNIMHKTPLMVACRGRKSCHTECVKLLLKTKECKVELRDLEKATALKHAIVSSNAQTVKALIANGVDLAWQANLLSTFRKTNDPVALSLSKAIWAMRAKIIVGEAEQYLSLLQTMKPTLYRRLIYRKLYSPAYTVLMIITNYLQEQENSK